MTGMLASVSNLDETVLVQEAGVDIIDLKDPRTGALGALEFTIIKKIVDYVNGITPVSATIGDLPFKAQLIGPVIKQMAETGVDIIKVGVSDKINEEAELQLLSTLTQQGIRIVLVLFAEQYKKDCDFETLAKTGITGVMLDTMNKSSGSLREKLSAPVLQQFVRETRGHGLLNGLAGSLSETDIVPLLEMEPDYLGFRGGLCQQRKREKLLDKETTINVRRQIPPGPTMIVQTTAII
jgi:(5-formylfuran-3-yl)methyl phosphate synthase